MTQQPSQYPGQFIPAGPQGLYGYNPPPAQYPTGAPQPQYANAGQPESFNSVAPPVGGESIKMHQLEGRLVLFRPTSGISLQPGYNGGPAKDQMTVEAIVFDGPPVPGLVDGRNGQVTKPFAAGPKQPPFYAATIYISHDLLLKQFEPLTTGRPYGFTLNRVARGQASGGNSAPFKLDLPSEQDQQLARSVIGNLIADGFDRIKAASAPEPEQQFQSVQQPPQQQYQQPQQAPQPYAQPTPQQYPPQGPAAAPWGQPPAQQQPSPWTTQ